MRERRRGRVSTGSRIFRRSHMEGPRAAFGTGTAREPPFDLAFRVDSEDHRAFWRKARRRPIERVAALLPVLAILAVAALVGLAAVLSSGTAGAAVGVAGVCAVVLYLVYCLALVAVC